VGDRSRPNIEQSWLPQTEPGQQGRKELKMAFLGLCLPHETARLLGGLDVPGKKEPASSFHVTLFYFGEGLDIEALTKIIGVTYGITSNTKPFTVRTNRVASFNKGPDGVPIICHVESDFLYDLRDKIKTVYEVAGIEFSNKFPEFRAHTTLAYAEEEGFVEQRIPTVEWGAHELVLWGGDDGDTLLVTHFPFALGDLDKAAVRVARRFLGL
jgi:2'-5' RNA ligase